MTKKIDIFFVKYYEINSTVQKFSQGGSILTVKSLDFGQGLNISVSRNLATTWPALQIQSNLSNFCKAAMISILQPDWQIDNGFLTGQTWHVLKS